MGLLEDATAALRPSGGQAPEGPALLVIMPYEPPESCLVYTPAELAESLVAALLPGPKLKWLEPCVGKGAFLRALSKAGVPAKNIVGLDLAEGDEPSDSLASTERGIDFLEWAASTTKRFDRIICNPPYLSISELPPGSAEVASAITGPDDRPLGQRANLWCAFLCEASRLLRKNGALGFILPASFQYADYAQAIRRSLPSRFESIHEFRCARPIFRDVQEGCVVLIARGFKIGTTAGERRTYASLRTLSRAVRDLPGRDSRRHGGGAPRRVRRLGQGAVSLKSVMDIRLGGVTGDATYFLMTERQRLELELPRYACVPVLSRAKHLHTSCIERPDWETLLEHDERVWLFRPTRDDALASPAVQAYLGRTPEEGGCRRDRYKIRSREPWYVTPLPPSPDAFVSGMSHFGPWLCLNNMKRLQATNTLYTVTLKARHGNHDPAAWALTLLSSRVRRQVRESTRRYADGLMKLEPGDIYGLQLPVPPEKRTDFSARYREAIASLLSGDELSAREIADTALRLS